MERGVTPSFRPEDIILEEGDVVYIESRDAEVFYTGGLLPGGEFPIPRDYDLDVLGAMALAGTGVQGQRPGVSKALVVLEVASVVSLRTSFHSPPASMQRPGHNSS